MRVHRAVDGLLADARDGAARHDQPFGIAAHDPRQEHEADEYGGGWQGARRGVGAPGDGNRCGDQDREHEHARIGVPVRDNKDRRGQEISAKRGRRDRLDLARLGCGPEQEAGDDQRCGKRKACDDAECMRRQQARYAHGDQRPQDAEHDGGDGQPAPHPHARKRKRGCRDDGDVDVERIGVTNAPTTPRPASAGPCSKAAASVPMATRPSRMNALAGARKP